jgi:hypothetical protein
LHEQKVRASFSLISRPGALKIRSLRRPSSGYKRLASLMTKSLLSLGLNHAMNIRRSLSALSLQNFARRA